MFVNIFSTRWMLGFTTTRGHSLGMLTDGSGLLWGRRAMNSLVPAGSYDDDLPEPPLPSEKPLRAPTDVPVPDPFDVPVHSPSDVPVREPHDVPPPPAEPPFPRQPQPPTPPERAPQARLKKWRKRRGRHGR
ncbi:MAG TPA: hypothetical protein VGM76_17585 [Lacipirellulaceae bacterium]